MRGSGQPIGLRGAALASTAMLSLIAPTVAHASTDDPWEPANRTFYMVHQVLDAAVFSKIAAAFKIIPAPIRTAVRNVIANLTEPGVAANDLLQGHPGVTARTAGRFVINTTIGLGGMIDVAGATGIPHHDNDFADTFGRWGVPPGPYLFITLIGPTTVRDGAGAIADSLTDPFTWAHFYHRWSIIDVRTVWGGLDQRVQAEDQLRAIDNMSTDSYASLRSLYLQNRAAVIASPPDAAPGSEPLPSLPDFGPADTGAAATVPPSASSAPAPADATASPQPSAALDPAPAPPDPHSEVLAAHRGNDKLLAAMAFTNEPSL